MVGPLDSEGEVKDVLDAGGFGVEVIFELPSELAERSLRYVMSSWILQRPQKLPR